MKLEEEGKKTREDQATELAKSLADRMKKKRGPGGGRRLGNRLSRRFGESEEAEPPPEPEGDETLDFFDEFENLSDTYPELKNVKVSELKKVVSKVGIKHIEEIVDVIRGKEFRTEFQKKRENWITY